MEAEAARTSLLQRIAGGEREAVAACIARYSGLVWSLARRFIANHADAEDAVQEIFMALWSNASSFDPSRSEEVTFVSMIARRRLIDRLRKSRREPDSEPLEAHHHGAGQSSSQCLETSAETAKVMSVIDAMDPVQRKVIRMSAWLGMSHGDIATETGMPLGTVKSHIRRGLESIRDQLGHAGKAEQ